MHAAVVGLDPADRRDQLPGQVAGGVGGVDDGLGTLVRRQGSRRDPVDGGVADGVVGVALHAGSELGAGRQARRGLDGLLRHGAAVGQRAVGAGGGGEPTAVRRPAMLTLQAAESRASGTRVTARWRRPNRASLIAGALLLALPCRGRVLPSPGGTPPTREVTHGLRALNPRCDLGHTASPLSFHDTCRRRGREADVEVRGAVGDNEPVTTERPAHRRVRGPVRAGPRGDSRRRELPGPGVQRRGRHPPVHPVGPRRVADRRRRQRVRRPGLLVGRDAARARPPRGPGGGRRRGGARHVVRHPDRARGRARRGDRRHARRSTRSASSPPAPRPPCPRSGWPAASPAATSW